MVHTGKIVNGHDISINFSEFTVISLAHKNSTH